MKFRLFLLTLIAFLVISPTIQAQQLSSEAKISLITCDPGRDIYSMYGHTAIRVNDSIQKIDVVFNYGVFSFDSPNFAYRFAKGQTDYLMIGQGFSGFLPEYHEDQRSVYEQELNLSVEGKNKLFQALIENAKPENREYRYNFFTDNCATRVRDMIQHNAGAEVHFTDNHPDKTFRDLIKEFHHSFRWIDLGIDLLVGKKADVAVSAYGQMFLPEYLFNQFAAATITNKGITQPLVLKTQTLVKYSNSKSNSDLQWPIIVSGILFLLFVSYMIWAYRNKKSTDTFDFWILLVNGLVGIIIGWFTLFSEHPAMSPNYNLFWAFPLNLVFAWIWRIRKYRSFTRHYFWIIALLLTVSPLCAQIFNPAVYLLIAGLLAWAVAHLIPAKQ